MRTGAKHLELREALELGGAVGRDLLSVDWASTAVGPPEEWSNALATIVRVLLTSRFSMWMAWGPELTFFCNEAYRKDTLARKYPWALGRPANQVWAEIWPEIGPRIEAVMSTGEATWDEALLLFLERSGYPEESYHTFSYSPLPDDDGTISGMLCVVSEDTERVIAERHMATLRDLGSVPASVQHEREFLQAAAVHLAGAGRSLPFTLVYLFESDGSAVLAAATGASPGEPFAPERIAAGDPRAVWPAAAAASGETVVVGDLAERFTDLPTGDWERPPSRALVTPLAEAAGGEASGFLVAGLNPYRPLDEDLRSFVGLVAQRLSAGVATARSYRDERRRAEQLAELDRAKTAFFSNVSHEFRTPLTLMLAPLQDALAEASGMAREQVELVHRNGLRLLKLVNALLDFSRIEAGRMQANFRPVDAAKLTADLASTFSDAIRRSGLELVVDCPPLEQAVYLDVDLWERVVLNLLSNAFKATLHGRITVALAEHDGSVELIVSDTGSGIAPDELPKLFQRFHRVRSSEGRSYEGTGIGLALVKELVELHGGEVDVDSRLGEGSAFRVTIPAGRAHLPAAQVHEDVLEPTGEIAALFVEEVFGWMQPEVRRDGAVLEPSGGVAADPDGASGRELRAARVLIADDNPDLQRYLTGLLSPNFEVEAVSDGASALSVVRERPPDLLITDAMMPVMDGFELLAALRSDPQTSAVPVIMLSARAGEEASIAGLEAGADDYLPKPFSGRELLARVRAHLDLSQERRHASAQLLAERQRLEQTLEQMPAGVIIAETPSGRILFANRLVPEIFGEVAVGAETLEEFAVYPISGSAGEPLPLEERPLGRAMREGAVVRDELLRFTGPDGSWRTLQVSAAPIRDARRQPFAGVLVFEDVTERVRAQRLLSAQRDILAMIARGAPLEPILEEIVSCLQRLSDFGGRASVLLVGEDGRHLVHGAAPDLPLAFNEAVDGTKIAFGAGSCGTAAHRRQTVIVEDVLTDPLWRELRGLAAEHGVRACWSTPILATHGDLVGTFAVYYDRPLAPTESDRRVVELLARSAAVAIERARDLGARSRQLNELQSSLLPPRLAEVPGVQAAVAYHAGDRSLEVGGDFYDLFHLGDGRWGFVIGDVCGHGADAAAVTALTRHTTRAVARMETDPGAVLSAVSEALYDSGYDRFCTAVYGWLEPGEEGVAFRLAIGGHPPPLIRRRDGTVSALEKRGALLGIFKGNTPPSLSGTLLPGDTLLLNTDGLYERNPRLEGEAALRALIARLPAGSAVEFLRGLERAALGMPPATSDDVAMLVLHAG